MHDNNNDQLSSNTVESVWRILVFKSDFRIINFPTALSLGATNTSLQTAYTSHLNQMCIEYSGKKL